jgi:hypothetical protein
MRNVQYWDRIEAPAVQTAMPRVVNIADGAIVLAFALLALLYQLGRWGGANPFIFLNSDAANIASFAAAWDHPAFFRGDEVLADPNNFRIYATLHIPLLRALAKWTGDYGSAFVSLLGPHVFVQTLGFYILGRVIFLKRFWAILLAIVTLPCISLNLGEYWGIYDDPLPRISFQALLPYLLAAAFYFRSKTTTWPWLLGSAGALIYIHPVSAPGWMLALWLGMWAFLPASWCFKKRLAYMSILAAVPVVVASPFVIHYLQNHVQRIPPESSFNKVHEIMTARLGWDALDVFSNVRDFIVLCATDWFYWAWAIVGAAVVAWLRRHDRRSVALVGLWTLGLLLSAVALPWADQSMSAVRGRLPLTIDLIRGIRYLVPLMLLFCLWPLADVTRKFQQQNAQRLSAQFCYSAGALLVALWAYRYPPEIVRDAVSCWTHGKWVCSQEWWPERLEALEAVRRLVPPGSTVLASDDELPIRYYARRPVVYSWKDGGILAYTNPGELIKWFGKYQSMEAVLAEKDDFAKVTALVNLSRRLKAQYVMINLAGVGAASQASGADMVWTNKTFTLFRITS